LGVGQGTGNQNFVLISCALGGRRLNFSWRKNSDILKILLATREILNLETPVGLFKSLRSFQIGRNEVE